MRYRSPGLTTAGGDGLSLIQAIFLIFGISAFLSDKEKHSIFSYALYIVSFVVLLLSIFLSGRTGFVIALYGIFVVFVFRNVRWHKFNSKFIARNLYLLIFLVLFFVLSFFLFSQSEYIKLFSRVFEIVLNYVSSGDFSTSSSDDLGTMYFLPTQELILTFGDGNFGRFDQNLFIHSDVGYIRFIFGIGVFGTFIAFVAFSLASLHGFISIKDYYVRFMVLFVSSSILIMNVKVLHFFGNALGVKVFFLVLFLSALSKFKNNRSL
ncbi:hypothetical protein VSVS12_00383 [Vibrio scophthalmi]|nr:hypothetical protein VSVS12_00383 [Vibrio scophthalmi]